MKPAELYILEKSEPFKSILLHLQMVISSNFPKATLQYKYKLPFYCIQNKALCYFNANLKKGYVDVGFYATKEFTHYDSFLEVSGRKMVKSFRYYYLDDIQDEYLCEILLEAFLFKYPELY